MRHIRLRPWRWAAQGLGLAVFLLIPQLNLFRLNLPDGHFYLYGQGFALASVNRTGVPMLLVVAFAFLLAAYFALFAFAALADRAFCGWVCPQGTLSELADRTSVFLFGRRGLSRRAPAAPGRRVRRRALRRWYLLLAVPALATGSAVLAFASLTYLATPERIWQALAAREGWIPWAFLAFWAFWAADILFLRHLVCRVCPVGSLYQVIFGWVVRLLAYTFPRWGEPLTVRLLSARAATCRGCGYCERVCFQGVPLLKGRSAPECVSCGDCVDACAAVLGRRHLPPAVTFAGAPGRGRRVALAAVALLVAGAWSAWPLAVPHRFVLRLETRTAARVAAGYSFAYRLRVTNETGRAHSFRLAPVGLAGIAVRDPSAILGPHRSRVITLRFTVPARSWRRLLGPGIAFSVRLEEGRTHRPVAAVPLELHFSGSLG
ncbi:MAG: 4Fe-4S binding protein [Thermaerobacter sp.]|nr:4Fe-4S binding protein [Thermaerobacter sp.]